jgi:hypothetical protein
MNISPISVSLMKAQALSSLTSSAVGAKVDDSWANMFSLLVSNGAPPAQSSSDPLALRSQGGINQSGGIKGLSPTGRNMGLPDPESAYKMMTIINNADVSYKAQFSEMSQMQSAVFQMQDAGQGLGGMVLSTGNDRIKAQLQDFLGQYNSFIQRFAPDIQPGGLLAGTQAAQASLFELEQNVNNRFFGIKVGVHGLSDLGFTIDTNSRLASLDTAKLDSLLATNKQGVVATMQEFSTNFSRSAMLLNSDGNMVLKQLDNLNRAIHFIADNKTSLQSEFGAGDAAKPVGQVAQALAAYNQKYGT